MAKPTADFTIAIDEESLARLERLTERMERAAAVIERGEELVKKLEEIASPMVVARFDPASIAKGIDDALYNARSKAR